MAKIRHYLKDLCTIKGIFEQSISAVQLRVMQSSTTTMPIDSPALQKFLEWYEYIFSIKNLASDPDPEILVRHIQWAQDAKRYHVEFLKAAFSTTAQTLPRWIYTIFELGRYGIASKALIQFAVEVPSSVERVQQLHPGHRRTIGIDLTGNGKVNACMVGSVVNEVGALLSGYI